MKRLAVVQIRGLIGVNKKIRDTFKFLSLYKKNSCVIVSDTPSYIGMLDKIKDYITWGELDKDTFKLLLEKRGRLPSNKPITEGYIKEKLKLGLNEFADNFMNLKSELKDIPGLKVFFRLKPPEGGFEYKGIKKQYSQGGALGYRKSVINDLIRRML